MTARGMDLKQLRDAMKRSAKEDRGHVTSLTVIRWVTVLDQIMRMPQWDPAQTEMFPGAPTTRNTDPATSAEAAEQVTTTYDLNKMRARILYLLVSHGALTDPEISEQYIKQFGGEYAESTIRKRRTECAATGWVSSQQHSAQGSHTVWQITAAGFHSLKDWQGAVT